MRTYDRIVGGALEPVERALGDLMCGSVKPGTRARVWDNEVGGFVRGTLEWWGGQASFKEDEHETTGTKGETT